jgi:hypothetical protein
LTAANANAAAGGVERDTLTGHPVDDVVVLVPGILGSRLERDGRPIWGASAVAHALIDPEGTLGLQRSGYEPDPDVKAVGLVGRLSQFPGLCAIDAYDRLVELLQRRFALDETNFAPFADDWRLSCAVNAALLAQRVGPLLEARRRSHRDAQLVFVCHSIGCLVVQHFTDVAGGGADTKEVITLGTPFRGAAKAVGVLSAGWPRHVPGIRSRFRRLAATLPSVYELLPRYHAVIDGGRRRRLGPADLPEGPTPSCTPTPTGSTAASMGAAPGPTVAPSSSAPCSPPSSSPNWAAAPSSC